MPCFLGAVLCNKKPPKNIPNWGSRLFFFFFSFFFMLCFVSVDCFLYHLFRNCLVCAFVDMFF